MYIEEGAGNLKVWDQREGKDWTSELWQLHYFRINTIVFSTQDGNLVVTSSTHGRACIRDLRNMKKDWSEFLNMISSERAVLGHISLPVKAALQQRALMIILAYRVGANFGDPAMISHKNKLGGCMPWQYGDRMSLNYLLGI